MLLGLQNVTFEFGARTIVEDATWHIQPNERIALIGYNGTGKSTLLKVLTRQYLPSKGTVEQGRETTIGFLHQDLLSFDTDDSILEVAMGAFERVKELEKEIEAIGHELERTGDEALAHDYSEKLHELEVLGGYDIHHKTEEILQGLGFSNENLHKPYKLFSGGWRMRVLLAKMILMAPDVLLLDEPTNHLDLPSIEWLEKYLIHYQGAVVMVSHDRYFLDRMVNKVVELYQQKLHFYTGNYSYYETEKALRVDIQQKAYENQQDYIRQNERFVERFKAKASKAAAAQSIVKRLEKLDRIENVEIERPNMRINFSIDKQPGRVLCTLKHVTKQFGDLVIMEDTGAEIDRGDKIALIGANGKGKSTLLRVIVGNEEFTGERIWGHNVEESFYAQHQLEALNIENSVLDEMKESRSGKTDLELRSLLGCFLFSGDDVDKKIKVLSGGEKARVALAKTIVSKANFLMLDEPTNHLDIHSVDLLIGALNNYEGSLVFVSHDRHFVSKIANKIWEIEDHKIVEFKGSYTEWEDWKERRLAAAKLEEKNTAGTVKTPEQKSNKEQPAKKETAPEVVQQVTQQRSPLDKELKKEYQKNKTRFQQIEEKLAQLNHRKAALETTMASPDSYGNKEKFQKTETEYKAVTTELSSLNKEYETVFEKVMELEEKMG
ncbi:ABC-F family ATP-binding cassette domain-containing protein [Ferruginibacter paludis]|uniref:ABC-F family ATP-binding cassette domain-containing protein n=1 Tax=Ferruginibacter paludis TaxID=1310417 RepID=UPI0025B55203|nr:ABC-F family ATP-binding cassette domain-containing protein [Ferruginibacter paludis]MDN3657498.1 ABC-F family ATP-binding cassette domain-containing protein [Ferruginibacter paludis]